MINEIIGLIQALKDLSIRKIAVLTLVCGILIAIWRFDVIVNHWIKLNHNEIKPNNENKSYVLNSNSDLDISEDQLLEINQLIEEYFNKFPPSLFSISIFKYLPPGYEYAYQGRILITFKTKGLDAEKEKKLVKDLNINWIPIYSGKETTDNLLNEKSIVLHYDNDYNKFMMSNSTDTTPSSNLALLYELGVKSIFRFPIIHDNKTVGYISIYLTTNIDEVLEKDLKRTATFLSSKLIGLLNVRGK